MPVSAYFDRFNPDLLSLIPPDAKAVLEIGCGAGALAAKYKLVNPGTSWYGIEANESAAYAAEDGPCDYVYFGDVETCEFDEPGFPKPPVDILVLGDVLEHLKDPWAQLARLAAYVKPGGLILACIPNVQHWTIIRDLMAGKWTYTDEGLMDRTHLRFFTLASIREMFDGAALQIVDIKGRDICNQGFEAWVAESGTKTAKEMRAYQYVVRAVKPPAAIETIHVHAVLAEACCARPRILEPFAALRTIPGVKCTTGPFIPPDTSVAIIQRPRFPILHSLAVAQSCLEHGRIIVVELDDDPTALEGMEHEDFLPLRACHAIQVSTEPLAEVCRKYNPNVMVFENQIANIDSFRESRNDIPRIFYGALNRQNDWKPIMSALNRVLKEFPDVGVTVVHDREFFDALDIKPGHNTLVPGKHFCSFCDYDTYRTAIRSCDIALLPLEPGQFNDCKSDLKFIECAAEGVVAIMGLTAAKAISPDCAIGMFYVPEPGFLTFEYNLRQLIDNDHNGRNLLAEKHYAYVRDHRMLGQHFRVRYEWYQELLKSKPALDRQLLERVPQLAQPVPLEMPALLP